MLQDLRQHPDLSVAIIPVSTPSDLLKLPGDFSQTVKRAAEPPEPSPKNTILGLLSHMFICSDWGGWVLGGSPAYLCYSGFGTHVEPGYCSPCVWRPRRCGAFGRSSPGCAHDAVGASGVLGSLRGWTGAGGRDAGFDDDLDVGVWFVRLGGWYLKYSQNMSKLKHDSTKKENCIFD